MRKASLIVILLFIALACHDGSLQLDRIMFAKIGKTFSTAEEVSIKEVHLDHSVLDETNVIITGSVTTVGEYNTYVVVSDQTARVLVIQTTIPSLEDRIKDRDIGKTFKIFGKLVSDLL